MVRCTPTTSAISATVCCLFRSGPVAWYMRRTVRPGASAQPIPEGWRPGFGDSQWYTCWYKSRNGQVASADTFQVRDSGSWTFPMTSAADPRDFRTMEITLGPPSKNGERAGPVILSGQTL